jgi:hypothetical protein
LKLIAVLLADGWQSLHSIATKTGVTTRTIRRDLELLEEAYFPVVTMRNDDGVRRWKLRCGTGCPLCGRRLSRAPNDTLPCAAVPDRPTAHETSPRV